MQLTLLHVYQNCDTVPDSGHQKEKGEKEEGKTSS